MPVKIAFRVIEASSEDEDFKALELNVQEPTAKGWRSGRDSAFPQHVTLELDQEVLIKKIQVLSHHCFIAQHIDVLVGNTASDRQNTEKIIYADLGRVHLAKRQEKYKVRELKSIHVKALARFVKLVLSEAHEDELNMHGQVSLLAINILGDVQIDKVRIARMQAGANGNGMVEPNERDVDHYSPLDDLSFLMYQDPSVVHIIKQLEGMRKDGGEGSTNVGLLISELESVGKDLLLLEAARSRAAEIGDPRKTNLLEKEVEAKRKVVQDKVQPLGVDCMRPERIQSTPVKIVGTGVMQPSAQSDPVVPLKSSPKSPCTPKSLPANEMESPYWSTARPIETPMTSAYHDYEERPLPTHRKVQEERSEEVREGNEEPTRDSESFIEEAEDLSEKDEKEAAYVIEVFGMPTAREIFSKKWNCKLKGLKSISQFLSVTCNNSRQNVRQDANGDVGNNNGNSNNNNRGFESHDKMSKLSLINLTKALELTMLRVSKVNIISVIKASFSVYRNFLLEFVPAHDMPRLDSFLQHTLPPFLSRLSDTSSRQREMTSTLILDLLRSHDFKYKGLLVSECFKMNKQGVSPKIVLGVAEIIFAIYLEKGMKDSGLTWDSLLKHLKDIMSTSCPNVRKFTRDFLSRLLDDLGSALPEEERTPGGHAAALVARIKNLLLEFDSVDKKSKGNVTSRSEEKPKTSDARKSSLVEAGVQKPLLQNQVNKPHPCKEKKIANRSVLAKPFKIPKENLPSQKSSSVTGPKQNVDRQNPAPKTILRKNSPHLQSLPTVKMPKAVPIKKPAAAVQSNITRQQRAPKQQQTTSNDRQLEHSEDKKAKRRSFSLDRKQTENAIDLPITGQRGDDNGKQRNENDERACVFCGKEGVIYSEDAVDQHYLTECPMLIHCDRCKMMLEISSLNNHRNNSCPWKELFRKCPKCKQAIHKDHFEGHLATNQCLEVGSHEELCPICGSIVHEDENSWRIHLTHSGLCRQTTRKDVN